MSSHSGSQQRRKRPDNNRSDFREFKDARTQSPQQEGKPHQRHKVNNPNHPRAQGDHKNVDSLAREYHSPANDDPMYERNLYVTLNLIGNTVEVQVKDGSIFEGVFHAVKPEGYGVVLKLARKKDPNAVTLPSPIETLLIPASELVQVIAKDINFVEETPTESTEFKTDKDISRAEFRERELVAWTPDLDVPLNSSLDNTFREKGQWNQFEVNEKLFGVKTSFNEELYTTPLDRNSDFYRAKSNEAQRLADEIMTKGTSNPHLAEERGFKELRDNDDEDEEDKYGAVIRPPTVQPNFEEKYVPPAKRGLTTSSDAQKKQEAAKPLPPIEEGKIEKSGSVEDLKGSPKAKRAGQSPQLQRSFKNSSDGIATELKPGDNPLVVKRLQLQQVEPSTTVPTSINALNLDPSSPKIPEEVVRDFQDFKTKEAEKREQKNREETLASLKNFQLELEKTAKTKSLASPNSSSTRTTSEPEKPSATTTTTTTTTTAATTTAPAASTAPAATPASTATTTTPASASTTTPAPPSAASTTPAPASAKSKLNPNAPPWQPGGSSIRTPLQAAVSALKPDANKSLNSVYSDAMKKRQGTETAEQTPPTWPYGRSSYKQIGDAPPEENVYGHPMRPAPVQYIPYAQPMPPPVMGYRPAFVQPQIQSGVYYPSGQQPQQYSHPRQVSYPPAQQPILPKQPYYPAVPLSQPKGAVAPIPPNVYVPPQQAGAAPRPLVMEHNPTQPLGTTPYPYTAAPAYVQPPMVMRFPAPQYQDQAMMHLPPEAAGQIKGKRHGQPPVYDQQEYGYAEVDVRYIQH